ncbi:hypothetical protein [Rhizobium sp. MHM7A]|uniref:hypothetical protein n=1 Tax=Rhizobium sp. MHM7A TaxID=2583233 RepID=UPI0011065373|nr:hypothetical protein [Rhizobium sp. MHM7A]TLX15976.1 hypothetical protein FFR93_01275 [Rhizobium sp. MHM7A]
MSYKAEPHEVGERFKLIMRRTTARNVWNKSEYIDRAKAAVIELAKDRNLPEVNGRPWKEFWMEKLNGSKSELCRLLSSRDTKDADITRYSPFSLEWMDEIFQDQTWRTRAIRKAKIGIISLQASLARKGDPRANHQFLWSEVNEELAHEFARVADTTMPALP